MNFFKWKLFYEKNNKFLHEIEIKKIYKKNLMNSMNFFLFTYYIS